MKILLVEDEKHKCDELIHCVEEVYESTPDIVDSVRSAILKVQEEDYDLIILDMALPTFGDNAEDRRKGHDQAEGGIEVIRSLKSAKKSAKIIIITQYPEFYIGGEKIKLRDSAKTLNSKYEQDVIGAILYKYKSEKTLHQFKKILRSIQ